MKQIRLGLIGAGERGANCYAPYALKYPAEVKFVCVQRLRKKQVRL